MAAILQSPFLLLLADVQVVFQNLNFRTDQHMLERKNFFQEPLALPARAKPHDPFHARSIVPTSIEQNHFLCGRQIARVALKVPACVVAVGWLAEGHDAGFPRAKVLDDMLDRPVLPACITPLEYHQHFLVMLDDILLDLDEFDLEIAKCDAVSRGSAWLARCLSSFCHFNLDATEIPVSSTGAGRG